MLLLLQTTKTIVDIPMLICYKYLILRVVVLASYLICQVILIYRIMCVSCYSFDCSLKEIDAFIFILFNLFWVTIDVYKLENRKIEVCLVSGGGGTHGGLGAPGSVKFH